MQVCELHMHLEASSAVPPAQLMEDARASSNIKAEQSFCVIQRFPIIPERCRVQKQKKIIERR